MIHPVMKEGRQMPYRNTAALPVSNTVAIPTCNRCGNEWIDEQTAEALDAALEEFVELGARRGDFVEPVPAAPVTYDASNVEVTWNGVTITGYEVLTDMGEQSDPNVPRWSTAHTGALKFWQVAGPAWTHRCTTRRAAIRAAACRRKRTRGWK